MDIQKYFEERVEDQVKYYSKKGRVNKEYYQLFKVSQLIAAALLPFFTAFISDYTSVKYIVALLGTMVTILEGVLAIGKYHEKWIAYRSTAETLKQEKFMFLMKAGSYTERNAALQFVNRIELILSKENSGWQQMIVKEKEEKGTPGNNAVVDPGAGNNAEAPAESNAPVVEG